MPVALAHQQTVAKVLVTAAVLVGSLVFWSSSRPPPVVYKLVDDLVIGGLDRWGDRELKVHGWVVPGSIHDTADGDAVHRSFVLERAGKRLRVSAVVAASETLRDQAEVVVTGRLVRACLPDGEREWVLESTEVIRKCADKYRSWRDGKSLETRFE